MLLEGCRPRHRLPDGIASQQLPASSDAESDEIIARAVAGIDPRPRIEPERAAESDCPAHVQIIRSLGSQRYRIHSVPFYEALETRRDLRAEQCAGGPLGEARSVFAGVGIVGIGLERQALTQLPAEGQLPGRLHHAAPHDPMTGRECGERKNRDVGNKRALFALDQAYFGADFHVFEAAPYRPVAVLD